MNNAASASKSAGYAPPESTQALVLRWIGRARESQFAHYEEAARLRRLAWFLGLPVILLTSSVVTAQFVSLIDIFRLPFNTQLITIVLSALAAAISAIQTIAQPAERAERHRSSGGAYGNVRRELEQYYAMSSKDASWDEARLHLVRQRLDALASDAPHVPMSTFEQVRRLLDTLDKADDGQR